MGTASFDLKTTSIKKLKPVSANPSLGTPWAVPHSLYAALMCSFPGYWTEEDISKFVVPIYTTSSASETILTFSHSQGK